MKIRQIKHFRKAELACNPDGPVSGVRADVMEHILAKVKAQGIDVFFYTLEVMGCRRKNKRTSPQKIAGPTLRDKSGITYLAGKLAERNSVTIARDDQLICLTREGRHFEGALRSKAEGINEKVAEELAMKELQGCIFVPDKISDNLLAL